MGRWWPAVGSGALSVAAHAQDFLKEVPVIFIISTIVWPQVKHHLGDLHAYLGYVWLWQELSDSHSI